MVPENMKEKLQHHLNSGFIDWTLADYQRFIKAFRKCDLGDIEGISRMIETKTPEEVTIYLEVFLKRFRELKEREIVIMKFEKKTFEQRTLESIRDFDKAKASRGEYFCMVQTNDYFTTETYLALMDKA